MSNIRWNVRKRNDSWYLYALGHYLCCPHSQTHHKKEVPTQDHSGNCLCCYTPTGTKKKQNNEITTFKEVIEIAIILGLGCYVSPPNRHARIYAHLLRNFIVEELKCHYERIILTAEYQKWDLCNNQLSSTVSLTCCASYHMDLSFGWEAVVWYADQYLTSSSVGSITVLAALHQRLLNNDWAGIGGLLSSQLSCKIPVNVTIISH